MEALRILIAFKFMKIDVSIINRVFGDRILVRRLERPEKIGKLLVPASYLKDKRKEQTIWFAVIEKFGLDSRYGDAYNLKEGDIIGISDIGNSNASFEGEDGNEYFWVMEEFIVLKDTGRIKEYFRNVPWNIRMEFGDIGFVPMGPYSVIKPNPEEEKVGRIILPKSQENLTGKVLSVSEGEVKNGEICPIRVNINSDVLFGKYSGLNLNFKDDKYLLIKEEDLIAEFNKRPEPVYANA